MCRLLAYVGQSPLALSELFIYPNNALIRQSYAAKEGSHAVSADGFGLAWYNEDIDGEPGIFRSTQPAWNDANFDSITRKIASRCFLGHVRASTVGVVSINNCHPFFHKKYSLIHNGTIYHFDAIKRRLLNTLSDSVFFNIKAQTDSEHLFYLILEKLFTQNLLLEMAVLHAFRWIINQQQALPETHFSCLNIVITNGEELVATRCVTKNQQALSLYYTDRPLHMHTPTAGIPALTTSPLMVSPTQSWIIASEPLSSTKQYWHPVPVNHYMYIDLSRRMHIKPMPEWVWQSR